ncbi:MAG: LysM peptidoglycan-binding domain-containing protein, partial [Bacteroidota bacterium]
FIAQTASDQVLTGDFGRANTFVQTSFFVSDLRLQLRILKNTKFQPYLAVGGGMMLFNPRDEEGNFLGENIFTRESGESYNTTIPMIPLAAGVQMRVNRIISLSMEYNYRVIPSDYLDNVGRLGKRDGDDILQGLQLSVHFNLNPASTPMPKQLVPATDPDYLIYDLKSGSSAIDTLAEVPAEADSIADIQSELLDGKTVGEWLKLEKEAIFNRKFIYLKVKAGQTLQQFSDHFHVRPETIRRINFMINEDLAPGSQLRIPDTGVSPADMPAPSTEP